MAHDDFFAGLNQGSNTCWLCSHPEHHRETPKSYKRSSLLCGRVLDRCQVESLGDLVEEWPGAAKNKPYKSIIAIPLLASDETPIGVVSIDSTRKYFFQSFARGDAEATIENSLLPYLQMLVLTLERLGSPNPQELLKLLTSGEDATQ